MRNVDEAVKAARAEIVSRRKKARGAEMCRQQMRLQAV